MFNDHKFFHISCHTYPRIRVSKDTSQYAIDFPTFGPKVFKNNAWTYFLNDPSKSDIVKNYLRIKSAYLNSCFFESLNKAREVYGRSITYNDYQIFLDTLGVFVPQTTSIDANSNSKSFINENFLRKYYLSKFRNKEFKTEFFRFLERPLDGGVDFIDLVTPMKEEHLLPSDFFESLPAAGLAAFAELSSLSSILKKASSGDASRIAQIRHKSTKILAKEIVSNGILSDGLSKYNAHEKQELGLDYKLIKEASEMSFPGYVKFKVRGTERHCHKCNGKYYNTKSKKYCQSHNHIESVVSNAAINDWLINCRKYESNNMLYHAFILGNEQAIDMLSSSSQNLEFFMALSIFNKSLINLQNETYISSIKGFQEKLHICNFNSHFSNIPISSEEIEAISNRKI